MSKKNNQLLLNLNQGFDIFIVAVAFIASYYIKKYFAPSIIAGLSTQPNYYFLLLLSIVTFHLSFKFFGFYDSSQTLSFSRIFVKIIKAVVVGSWVLGVMLFLMQNTDFSRIMFMLFSFHTFVFLLITKFLTILFLKKSSKRACNSRNILLIGSKERARKLIETVILNSDTEYHILGCLEINKELVGTKVLPGQEVKVIGTLDNFRALITNQVVDDIIFAMPLQKIPDIRSSISFAEELGINIYIMPDWQIHKVMYRSRSASISYDEFVGLPAISLSSTPQDNIELQLKSFLDYFLSLAGLILLSPICLIIAVLIKLTSPGPIFFRQIRSGLNGRKFTLYKFRTMVANAEEIRGSLDSKNELKGPAFKMTNDPRITWLGKLLRKTSLDEIPQLINILQGDMSIVGPRPPIPSEVEQYKFWQRRRLSMKPGLTCIWQVKSRNNTDFDHWMNLDLEYIDGWSLWLDVKLISLTIPAMFFGTGK